MKSHLHKISRVGLDNAFVEDYGDQSTLLESKGITDKKLVKKMLQVIKWKV